MDQSRWAPLEAADPRLDRAVDDTLAMLGDAGTPGGRSARRLAGAMAACLQGALLVRFAPPEVADAFCATRLDTAYDGTLRHAPARRRRLRAEDDRGSGDTRPRVRPDQARSRPG